MNPIALVLDFLQSDLGTAYDATADYGQPPAVEEMAHNDRITILHHARRLTSPVVLYLGPAATTRLLRTLMLLGESGKVSHLLAITHRAELAEQQAAQMATVLARHQMVCDLIVVDPSVPPSELAPWFAAFAGISSPLGLMQGGHVCDGTFSRQMQQAISGRGFGLAMADGYWTLCRGAAVVPLAAPFQRAGAIQPVHFASMEEDLGRAPDRDRFLEISGMNIPCYHVQGGGDPYVNKIPLNMEHGQFIREFGSTGWGYRDQGTSQGGMLAYLRDVRMAGPKGFLFSPRGAFYEESFNQGQASSEYHKRAMPIWEPSLQECRFALGENSIPHYGYFFTRTVDVEQPAVIASWADLWCYNHWVGSCLSRLWYREAFPELAHLPIVMNPISHRYQQEYLQLLGLGDHPFIFHHPSTTLRFKGAYFSSLADRPYNSSGNIQWLRSHFLHHAAKVPAGYENGLYYISRGDAANRSIDNEQDILDLILPAGFQCLEWSRFSVREQIALARHARVIIGQQGSCLINATYASPGCCVLDIPCPQVPPNAAPEWITIFGLPSLGVHYFLIQGESDVVPYRSHTNYRIDMDKFRSAFQQIMDIRSS